MRKTLCAPCTFKSLRPQAPLGSSLSRDLPLGKELCQGRGEVLVLPLALRRAKKTRKLRSPVCYRDLLPLIITIPFLAAALFGTF